MLAILVRQSSEPYGAPRFTDFRNASSSAALCGPFHPIDPVSPLDLNGPATQYRFSIPINAAHKLYQRQPCARSTSFARNALRST